MDQTVITLLAKLVAHEALHDVRAHLIRRGFKIQSVQRIHENLFHRVELICLAPSAPQSEIPALLELSSQLGIDVSLESFSAYRTPKKLLLMDIDSTLIQNEIINEMACEKGNFEEIAAITHLSMQGKIDFDESLIQRVLTFRGLEEAKLFNILPRIRYTQGAQDLIRVAKTLGVKVGVISGGFSFMANHLKQELGLDYAFANELEIKEGALTGRILPPLLNAKRKAEILEDLAIRNGLSALEVIAIGDGANDIPMLEKAGLGIAFNAKPIVRPHANLALNHPSLLAVAYLMVHTPEELSRVLCSL